MRDTEVFASVERELNRQRNNIELIASENFVSKEIMELAVRRVCQPTLTLHRRGH